MLRKRHHSEKEGGVAFCCPQLHCVMYLRKISVNLGATAEHQRVPLLKS